LRSPVSVENLIYSAIDRFGIMADLFYLFANVNFLPDHYDNVRIPELDVMSELLLTFETCDSGKQHTMS
jgi:hypothetical protein